MRSQSASDRSGRVPNPAMPWLFTSTWTGPSASRTVPAAPSTLVAAVTSHATPSAAPAA